MSSHTISHHLLIFFLMPEERERKESENERKRQGIEFPYLLYVPRIGESCVVDLLELVCPGSNYFDHQV
jgi:hypothetical protein